MTQIIKPELANNPNLRRRHFIMQLHKACPFVLSILARDHQERALDKTYVFEKLHDDFKEKSVKTS